MTKILINTGFQKKSSFSLGSTLLFSVYVCAWDVPPIGVVAASRRGVGGLEGGIWKHNIPQGTIGSARPVQSQCAIGRSDIEAQGAERHPKVCRVRTIFVFILVILNINLSPTWLVFYHIFFSLPPLPFEGRRGVDRRNTRHLDWQQVESIMHEDRVVSNWLINEVGGRKDEGINCSYNHHCHHKLEEKEHARNVCRKYLSN